MIPNVPHTQDALSKDMRRCIQLLSQTSRSFAAVIQALDDELRYNRTFHSVWDVRRDSSTVHIAYPSMLRPAICIFYLVLRALDTVEDDMKIPVDKKIDMLKDFHTHLYEEGWTFMDSSEKDKAVLEEFPVVR